MSSPTNWRNYKDLTYKQASEILTKDSGTVWKEVAE